jgi:hypothetical protein
MNASNSRTKPALTVAAMRQAFPSDSSWQISPAIDRNKLDVALASYGRTLVPGIDADAVMALHDATLFRNGRKGALITRSGIVIGVQVFADGGRRPINRMYVPFRDLKKVSLKNSGMILLQTSETFEWICPNADAVANVLNDIISSSSPVIVQEPPRVSVPSTQLPTEDITIIEKIGDPSPEKTPTTVEKQLPWYFIILILLVFGLFMWGVSKVFGLWVIGVVIAVGALLGWLDDLKKKGNDELKRQFKVVSKFVVSGIGGGLGFLFLRFMGIPLYRLPDFKRVSAQDDWVIVFVSGLATAIMLAVLPALNSKNQKKNEK